MAKVVFVEGGGSTKKQQRACRQAFAALFRHAGLVGLMPRVTACGSREQAYKDFRNAFADDSSDPVLLVDSEGPLQATDAWSHLWQKDGWERPDGARADSAHLMVQVMESWFLADTPALEGYFGRDFSAAALPQNSAIEDVPKADVLDGIKNASRNTNKAYDKGRHSFEILQRLDVSRVTAACPRAKRLIDALQS